MKNEEKAVELFQGVTDVGDDLIEEAGTVRKRRKITPWRGMAIAACLCAALLGTAFAAKEMFGSWIISIERDGDYYVQKAYSEVKRFTAEDFSENILWSPEGEGWWYVGADSWQEMEDYLGYPLIRNSVLDASPQYMFMHDGDESACSICVWYCEHGDTQFPYQKTGRDMSPYAGELEYISVQSSSLVDGVRVTVYGTLSTELDLEHHSSDFPLHGIEYPAGTLSEYVLANGIKAVVYHPQEDADSSYPEAWFVYEGTLYYVITWEAPLSETEPDPESALYRVLDGFQF